MKRCTYCGKQEADDATVCSGCGTALVLDEGGPSAGFLWPPRTPIGIAVATGLGVLLISGALFIATGFAALQFRLLPGGPPPGQEEIYTFFYSSLPAPFIPLAAAFPTFALCRARCRAPQGPHITASVTVGVLLLAALLPLLIPGASFFWCVPASLLAMGIGSAGCYVGAALQLALGAWLLIRLRAVPENDDAQTA